MSQSPLSHYRRLIGSGAFSPDADQEQVVQALESLWQELSRQPPRGLLRGLRARHAPAVRGIYLWGSVGRGKTWLMDLFFDSLAPDGKQRTHFHRFMQRIHHDLRDLGQVRDPLQRIADRWASRTRILCLDEFFVADIADAMLLAGLFEQLFTRGVTLIATSNVAPDDLYRGGLQRAKFLPAIELLKRHTRVLRIGGVVDFRLRILEMSEIFHHPLDAAADRVLAASFDRMAAECELDHDFDIDGRSFHARRRGDGIIWFDFEELCQKPRGSVDYIELARMFNTVVISNAPQLGDRDADAARRFITLVDEFYDRNVKLLMSAAVPIDALYTGQRLAFEFQRTASRLTEMQSHDYLARPHLP